MRRARHPAAATLIVDDGCRSSSIFVIMYFLILRPQQKRAKQHQEMVKNVRRGDTVVTSGGLVGKVTKVRRRRPDRDRDRRRRAGAPDAHGRRGARQGRAGEGRGRRQADDQRLHRERRAQAIDGTCSISRAGRQLAILLTAFVVCAVRGAEFLSPKARSSAGRNGRSATSCSASTCRAARTSCSRSTPTRCARRSSRRCATTSAACCARPALG